MFTDERIYFERREFLKLLALSALTPALAKPLPKQTSLNSIQSFGNYYEFTRSNRGIADLAKVLPLENWELEVGGLVEKPMKYSLDDLKRFESDTKIHRHRCNEAWSMIIPWRGIALRDILLASKPKSSAKWVRFIAQYDPKHMLGQDKARFKEWFGSVNQRDKVGFGVMGLLQENPYKWPYSETLRLDEALHPLVMLATGVYDKNLPPENGAPLRLVVPWKYAFKSIKAVVRIELVEAKPSSFWHHVSPKEFGFWGNVNPDVPHPRWKQGREYLFLDSKVASIEPTRLFNGYAKEVYHLYKGVDIDALY